MKKLTAALFIFFLTFAGCNQVNNNSINEGQIQNEVIGTLNTYIELVNSGNHSDIEHYFSSNENFYWAEDGRLQYPNRDSLITAIRQFYSTVDSLNMIVTNSRVDVLNRNYAMLYAEFKEDFWLSSDSSFSLDGAFTVLMSKENEEWKFLHGHSSVKKQKSGS